MISSMTLSRFAWQSCIVAMAFALTFFQEVEAFSLPSQCKVRHHRSSDTETSHRSLTRCNNQLWIPRLSPHTIRPVILHSHSIDSEEGGEEQTTLHVQKYWTLPRLFVGSRRNDRHSSLPLTLGARIPLSPDQSHYLNNVMRIFKKRKNKNVARDDGITVGSDCIRIFNGANGEWLAKVYVSSDEQNESSDVKGGSKKRNRSPKQNKQSPLVAECILQLREQDCNEDERPWILFAPLKKQPRMKNMIEKCTELGVGKIIPVESDHVEGGALMALVGSSSSEPNIEAMYGSQHNSDGDSVQFDKLKMQSIEAAEQSERLSVPLVTKHITSTPELWKVRNLVEQWEESQHLSEDLHAAKLDGIENDESIEMKQSEKRVLLICRERGSDGVVPVLQALSDSLLVAFLVGPEGGWSAEEEELFDEICSKYSGTNNDAPVRCVSLGSSVLRAETCCMMAVGAWALAYDSQ